MPKCRINFEVTTFLYLFVDYLIVILFYPTDGAGSSGGLRGNGGAGREYGEEEEDDQGELCYFNTRHAHMLTLSYR